MKLRHVVLFGFVAGTDVGEVARRFGALKTSVPRVEAFEWGEDCSPEGLADGRTHAFVLTFDTAAARDAYLIHPEHQAFVDWVKPSLAAATVIDYWAAPSF